MTLVHVPETPETFDGLLQKLAASATQMEKNIIVLETLALMKFDGVYDEKEQNFIVQLAKGLNVSSENLLKLDNLLNKYLEIGKELYAAITE